MRKEMISMQFSITADEMDVHFKWIRNEWSEPIFFIFSFVQWLKYVDCNTWKLLK